MHPKGVVTGVEPVAGEPKEKLASEDGPAQEIAERENFARVRGRLLGREEFVRQLLANFPNGSVNVFDGDLRYLLAEGRGSRRRA